MAIYKGIKKREKVVRAHPTSITNFIVRTILVLSSIFYASQFLGKRVATLGFNLREMLVVSPETTWVVYYLSVAMLVTWLAVLLYGILAKEKLARLRSWAFLWCWFVLDGVMSQIIYNPFSILVDANSLFRIPGGREASITAFVMLLVVGATAVYAYKSFMHKKYSIEVDGIKGTAEWGDPRDLEGKSGLLVGKNSRKNLFGKTVTKMLRDEGEDHIVTIAKTGYGKGVGVVIPALLDYPHSVVVSDLKGENFAVTAHHRIAGHNNTVWVADPDMMVVGYPVDAKGNTRMNPNIKRLQYNPLSILEDDMEYGGRLSKIVNTIIETNPNNPQPFFDNDAMKKLRAAISVVWTLMSGNMVSLYEVAKFLSFGHADVVRLAKYALSVSTHPEASMEIRVLIDIEELQYEQAESTIMANMGFVTEALMWDSMSSTTADKESFNPETLKSIKQSVYLVINDQKAKQYKGWVRMMVSSILAGVRESDNVANQRVLFMLDEFANMGKMDEVIEGFSKDRGRHIRYWCIVQNLHQLMVLYKGFERLLADAGITQFFGINDDKTAKMLSEGLGTMTVQDQSAGIGESSSKKGSVGDTGNRGVSINDSLRSERRPLMLPTEIKLMERGKMVLDLCGSSPLLVDQPHYLYEREFEGKYDYNQYHLPKDIENQVRSNRNRIRDEKMKDLDRRFRDYDTKSSEVWKTMLREASALQRKNKEEEKEKSKPQTNGTASVAQQSAYDYLKRQRSQAPASESE